MDRTEFVAFYPQFAGFAPEAVLSAYLAQANERFSSFGIEDAAEARRLYIAHKLTLYARSALPENTAPTLARIAEAGGAWQRIATKKVGEVSVTYSSGASSAVSAGLADLPETSFGLRLLSLLKQYARSVYIP